MQHITVSNMTMANPVSTLPVKSVVKTTSREGLILRRLSTMAVYQSKYGMIQHKAGIGTGQIDSIRRNDRYLYDLCLQEAISLGTDVKTYVEMLGFKVASIL